MAFISSYPLDTNITLTDKLIGTDENNSLATKQFEISTLISFIESQNSFVNLVDAILPTYANNAAAVSGGLAVNSIYKTATGEVRIVV